MKIVRGNRRRETSLGRADDDNAGPGALAYKAAIAAALEWGIRERVYGSAEGKATRPTVASAVSSYTEGRELQDARRGSDARSRLTKHVLSDKHFSQLSLEDLTVRELRAWRQRLNGKLAPATVNRLQNDLRAALNAAVEVSGRELPASTRQDIATGLRSLRDAEQARRAILSNAEVRTIIAAAQQVDDRLYVTDAEVCLQNY